MELEEVIAQYSYLWDGTEDWVLSKHMHQAMRLKIKCSGKRPSVSELLAIRKLLEHHRHVPPAELRSMIQDTGELDLGNIAPPEPLRLSIEQMTLVFILSPPTPRSRATCPLIAPRRMGC